MEEKKKRKINIIDIVVIVIIILAVAVVGIKLMGNRVQEAVSNKVDCYAEIVIIGAQPRIFNEVLRQDLVGEKMVSGNIFLDATIEDVWLEDYVVQATTDDGRRVDAKDPTQKNIVVLVKCQVAEGTPSPKIGSQELRAGKTFIVKTQRFETSGTIRYVEFGEYNSTYRQESTD